MTTIDQLYSVQARQNEVWRRLKAGSLNVDDVLAATQGILDGIYPLKPSGNVPTNPPSWWRTPGVQLRRARQLWPDAVLPEPPKDFVPQTETEVLLLHVPRPFDELWDKAEAPTGYTKFRTDYVKSDKRNLRLAPSVPNRTEPVWLGFDPEANKGTRPDSLWGQSNLAACEVLSALIQFPDWPLAWFNGASAPNLSGYQLKYDGNWSYVPYLRRWAGSRQLGLNADWAGRGNPDWASPVVREC